MNEGRPRASTDRRARLRRSGRVVRWTGLAVLLAIGAYAAWLARSVGPLAKAEHAYRQGAWREAAAEATRLLKAEPTRVEALVLLARAEARLGRNQAARGLYRRLDPQGLEAEDYFLVGRGLIADGQVEQG